MSPGSIQRLAGAPGQQGARVKARVCLYSTGSVFTTSGFDADLFSRFPDNPIGKGLKLGLAAAGGGRLVFEAGVPDE
jgi:hypothetical protein